MIRRLAFAATLLAVAQLASAEPVTTIQSSGNPANRVDLVVLGDGYTAAEMGKYASDVSNAVNGFFASSPYSEYRNFFNVYRVDVTSAESGADHDTPSVIRKNTAFDGTFDCAGIQRLVCVDTTKVNAVLTASIAAANQRDMVLVLVNDPQYGGSGGAIAVASTHTDAIELVLHETGHSFGLLADEYDYSPPTCYNSIEPSEANATHQTVRASIKWTAWIDAGTPIPTSTTAAGIPGLYQGAKYCTTGLYRPTYDSKMRNLNRPFEQINSEQIIRRIYNYTSPIDSVSPTASTVIVPAGTSQAFTVSRPVPATHSLTIQWQLDGVVVGSGTSYTVGAAAGAGTHTLQLRVNDGTSLVRNDPGSVLVATRTWTVTVQVFARLTRSNFDGDGKSEIGVYRGSNGYWYLRNSSAGYAVGTGNWIFQWGASGDIPQPADYDGDGKTDPAVFRPSTGQWFILYSSRAYNPSQFVYYEWGATGDTPLAADFDGDGKADIAVYRPSTGYWYLRLSSAGYVVGSGNWIFQWGASGDTPMIADFDGDGKTDITVFRPSSGQWFIRYSASGYSTSSFGYFEWGASGDGPLTADFDGDGKSDLGVFRPSNGYWYLRLSSAAFAVGSGNWIFQWGATGDLPRLGDFDGDGKVDITVFRPSTGQWFIRYSGSGYSSSAFGYYEWGATGDTSLPTY